MSDSPIPPPVCLSILLCDAVITDPATHKTTIFGVFDAIAAPSFPVRHPSLTVHLCLTEVPGLTRLCLRVVDIDDEDVLFTAEPELPSSGPLEVHYLSIRLTNLTFPAEGDYLVKLFVAEEQIAERRLSVTALDTGD